MWAYLASVSEIELPRTSGVVAMHTSLFVLAILCLVLGAGVLWRTWGLLGSYIALTKRELI